MNISWEAWRDRILLFLAWAIMVGSAVVAWAAHSQTIGTAGRVFGSRLWASLLLAAHAAFVFAILFLPPMIWATWRAPLFRRLSRKWMPSLGRRPATLICLALLGILQPLYLVDIGRVGFTVDLAETGLAVILALLLLYRGSQRQAPLAAFTGTVAILELNTRTTVQGLQSLATGSPGLLWPRVWVVILLAFLAALTAFSLVMLIPGCRSRAAKIVASLPRSPVLAGAVLFAVSAGAVVAARFAGTWITRMWLFERLLASGAAIVVGYIVLRSLSERETWESPAPREDRRTFVWGALGIAGALYLIQAFRLARNLLYYLNPDGVVYMIIARDFGRGLTVIRGCWSPLLPALIAPAVRFGVDPQVGERVLATATGFAWTAVAIRLGLRVRLHGVWLIGLGVSMSLIALQNAFQPITPDMLGALILGVYFLLVTSDSFLRRPGLFGALAGLLGALAFYAQFYNLPFFLVHLGLTSVWFVLKDGGTRRVIASVLAALAVAATMVTPWVIALHGRYGYWTLSTTSAITHAVDGPSQGGHPCWDKKLCASPQDVLIPWEDPQVSDYADRGWNILGSWENIRYQILHTRNNMSELNLAAFDIGPTMPIGILLSLSALFLLPLAGRMRFLLSWGLMTLALYSAGYLLFHVEERFFLPVVPIAVIAVFRCAQAVFESPGGMKPSTSRSLAGGVTAFAILLTFLHPAEAGLRPLPPDDHCVAATIAEFSDKLVAPMAGSDRWVNIIAYHSEKRTLGVLPPSTTGPDADSEFHRLGIRTYIVGHGLQLEQELLGRGGYVVVAQTNLCGSEFDVLRTPVE